MPRIVSGHTTVRQKGYITLETDTCEIVPPPNLRTPASHVILHDSSSFSFSFSSVLLFSLVRSPYQREHLNPTLGKGELLASPAVHTVHP